MNLDIFHKHTKNVRYRQQSVNDQHYFIFSLCIQDHYTENSIHLTNCLVFSKYSLILFIKPLLCLYMFCVFLISVWHNKLGSLNNENLFYYSSGNWSSNQEKLAAVLVRAPLQGLKSHILTVSSHYKRESGVSSQKDTNPTGLGHHSYNLI
jgi:hypothetical protein